MITLFRIDDRLLHGQVARSWTRKYRINKIIIINNEVANDEFSKMTLCLAKPKEVELKFSEVSKCEQLLHTCEQSQERVMCIVNSFSDANLIIPYIPRIKTINIGGLRNKGEKNVIQITGAVILCKKDIQIAHQWFQQEIEVEIRQIPGEKELKLREVLKNEKDFDCSSHA